MNRAIKFRAWHKRLKRMYPVRAIDFAASPMEVHLQSDAIALDTFLDKRDVEPMQFTGMLDKHGREVYEGDIVAIGSTRMEVQFGLFAASELAIADGHEWEDSSRAMAWNINEEDASRGEVIGNIYENKEV